ncbi:MAG: PD-(D/E)XK motif protein [Corynebacterium sp.]|uniref:PD-(D/E)XK motif protein n=1 Tax=unclassified Corynebacterium TaxID=2624378 RepID=UPI003F931A88
MKLNPGHNTSLEQLKNLDAYRASQRTPEETYEIDLGLTTGTPYLVANIDHSYGVAVPVGSEWLENYDRLPQHTSLKLVTTSTFHRSGVDYIQVTLSDEKLLRTFGDFVDNLCDALRENEKQDPGAVTVQLLTESQRLFRAAGTAVPSNEIQVGLLLELETLRSVYETVGADVLRRWTGPDNERHDFELQDSSIECKATLSRENLAVTIHGAHQLSDMGEKPLVLLVRKYEKTIDGGTSVPDLIREISALVGIDTEELLRKLGESGLSPEVLEKDAEFTRFLHLETHEFDVDAEFPRVPVESLSDRISRVAYTVDLRDPSTIPGHRPEPQILEKN